MVLQFGRFFKHYSIEIIYLVIILIVYFYISASYETYLTRTPSELIRLIHIIPSENNKINCWIVTDTNEKTIQKILNTKRVLNADAVVNLSRPENIENAFRLLKKKFNLPIYFIVHSNDNEFRNKFLANSLDFPFKKIYGYGTYADDYTLYLFSPKE